MYTLLRNIFLRAVLFCYLKKALFHDGLNQANMKMLQIVETLQVEM